MTHQDEITQEDLLTAKNWFYGLSFAMVFAIIWAILGENDIKILFIAVTFTLFLRAGIKYDETERALNTHH